MSPQTRRYKAICDETRTIDIFSNRCVSDIYHSQIVTILHDYSQTNFSSGSQKEKSLIFQRLFFLPLDIVPFSSISLIIVGKPVFSIQKRERICKFVPKNNEINNN